MDKAVWEEFYKPYLGKSLYKKLVLPQTLRTLEEMENHAEFGGSGEPYISSLLSFLVLMSEPRKILETGTLIGYSTLIMADALKQNGLSDSLIVTVDPNKDVQKIAAGCAECAGLSDLIHFHCGSSTQPAVLEQFAPFDMLFIDSIHNYRHTTEELRLLTPLLGSGSLLVCHDSGERARDFDTEQLGGVRRAITEWTPNKKRWLMLEPPRWAPIGAFVAIIE